MSTAKTPPQHAQMDQFQSLDDQLLLNKQPINLLKHRAGQMPFYAYDRSVISQTIKNLREQLPPDLKFHYAIKANSMPALVDFISDQVDGLDVASGNELQVALNSGIGSQQISFAGPGKQELELTMAVATQTTVNVESFNELKLLHKISNKLAIKARVALRVNPDFELKSSGMKMGGGAQQFGIDAENIPRALQLINDYDLHYRGLHIFTGSQNLNADAIIASHTNIFQLASKLQKAAPSNIETLNIGGGLGIPYFPGDKPIELKTIGESLKPLMNEFKNNFGDCEIAMELGRYLVGSAGIYVCEVIDIKQSRGVEFVIVNGGLHHHLAASGNFGQIIRKNYPVAIGNKMQQANHKPVQIVGPLCTPLDILAHKYQLPKVEIGDLVVIYQSGAYGFSASPRDFLSHPQPVEILV